jgi:diacylglycerol kinase family enzyme
MQAAAALVGTDVPLGLLPGGTGNLLAANLGLPTNPLEAARAVVAGVPGRIDLGRLENAAGVKYFAVAAGAGIDARVMVETSSAMKRRWGTMAYVAKTLQLLPDLQGHRFRITVDGVVHEVEAAMMLVANCGMIIPPILSLGSHISPVDGILDIVIVQASSVAGGVRAVWDLVRDAKGTFGKDVFIGRHQGKEVAVEVIGGVQPVQMDGDGGGETPFTVAIMPGALQVMQAAT